VVVAVPRFLNKEFPLMGLTASRMALQSILPQDCQ